jgi:gliding motility-associated-like protein
MRNFFLFILLLTIGATTVTAQSVEAPEPTALVVNSKGELTDLEIGESYPSEDEVSKATNVPLTVRFYANAHEVPGYSITCMWEFFKEGDETPYLVRHDEDIEIELRESGTVTVMPTITYTSKEDYNDVKYFAYDPFRITIPDSSLEAPNAFSPNGDGINDYYNVFKVKSIVEFQGAIYNRWGQELYRWGIDEMGNENSGWDGTYKGRQVSDGVYYVVINARGADGIRYEIRRDVNLLRGFTEVVK